MNDILFAIAGISIAFIGLAIASVRAGRRQRAGAVGESLSMQDRSMLTPLRRAAQELEDVVAKNSDSTTIKILGKEAIQDAQTMLQRAEAMLVTRRELKRVLTGEFGTKRAIEDLENRVITATSGERATLESALAARRLELGHYQEAKQGIERIEATLKQAEAALSEIKTRLSLAGSQDREEANANVDELRDALIRVRSLGESFEETQDLLA